MRILILDDDHSYGALLASASKKLGHRTIVKVDAQEAVQILRNEEADIALVDLEMPNGSGTAFAKTLRKNGITVPVAFCTGTCRDLRLIEEAESMGQVLPKIWTHADLRAILSALQLESNSLSRFAKEEADNREITEPSERKSAEGPVDADTSQEIQRLGSRPHVDRPNSRRRARPSTREISLGSREDLRPQMRDSEETPPLARAAAMSPPALDLNPPSLDPPTPLDPLPPDHFDPMADEDSLDDVDLPHLPRENALGVDAIATPPFQANRTGSGTQQEGPPKKRLDEMLEVGDALRETPRVNIGCSNWEQVRRLCSDVMRGMSTITVRARSEMRAGEDVVVALELPDEMVVSIAARVLDFRERSADGKRPYQLDLVGFGSDEIAYLLGSCEENGAEDTAQNATTGAPASAPSPALPSAPGPALPSAPSPALPSAPSPALASARIPPIPPIRIPPIRIPPIPAMASARIPPIPAAAPSTVASRGQAAELSSQASNLPPATSLGTDAEASETRPSIPDAIDASDSDLSYEEKGPSISWS